MVREEGGGFRMGNTCIPVADSFQYLAKPIQYCKLKKKNKQVTKNRLFQSDRGKRVHCLQRNKDNNDRKYLLRSNTSPKIVVRYC